MGIAGHVTPPHHALEAKNPPRKTGIARFREIFVIFFRDLWASPARWSVC
jgi:hypothetical protein